MKRKCISMLMMIAIILSMIPMSIPVMAKENLPSVSGSVPIYTYTYKSSGKIYRYTDSSLKTKEKGHWIDCAKDECKIIGIKNDAVKVVYPTSKGPKTGWFMRSEFCKRNLKADQAKYSFRATKKITTYRWKENNTVYGFISKGDKTYLLRGDQNSSWLQVLYPVSGGYKMAWVKGDDLYANNIKLNKSSINKQGVGWSETLTATLSPSNSDDYVSWSSSNPSVATVSGSGVVTGVGYGTTVITATTKRGKTAKVFVNVGQPAAKHFVDINCVLDGKEYWDLAGCATVDIYINGKADETNVNDYYKEWPEGTRFEVRNIKTKSGFKYDGVRNSGLSGTVRNGKVDIRLVFKKNKSQTVPVTGIKLNKTSASIAVGKTLTLSATVSPSNATNKNVKWSSSNTSVATVSGGKVKGVEAGTTTITAKSNNGKIDRCTVKVTKKTKNIEPSYQKYKGINYQSLLKKELDKKKISKKEYNNRLSLLNEAKNMATVVWTSPISFATWKGSNQTYNSNNKMLLSGKANSRYKFVKGCTYVGIPYCANAGENHYTIKQWFSLINSTNVKESTFQGKVSYLGIVRKNCTRRGIDCSGFVYRAYNTISSYTLGHQSTGDMVKGNEWKKIKASQALPGDILLKKGHVMIYIGKTSKGKIAVLESVADGTNGFSGCRYYEHKSVSSYNYYRFTKINK